MIGVGVIFSCSHRDSVRNELHGHTYEAVACFRDSPERDAFMVQAGFAEIVKAALDHKTLPDGEGTQEAMRLALLKIVPEYIVDVHVHRPLERIYHWGER